MSRLVRLLVACCLVLHGAASATAARAGETAAPNETELRELGFEPLAAGDALDAWSVEPWHAGHWTLSDGVINYDGQGTHPRFQKNSLWSKRSYHDLELYIEWRLPREATMKPHPIVLFNGDFLLDHHGKRVTRPRMDAGDSGVMLRGLLDCQANIWCQELGSGEVNGYRTNRNMPPEVRRACIPIRRADRPPGEWNAFHITLRGERLQVVLNGEKVVDVTLPDLPAEGPIGLQHHGDPVQFRKLWVKRLQ